MFSSGAEDANFCTAIDVQINWVLKMSISNQSVLVSKQIFSIHPTLGVRDTWKEIKHLSRGVGTCGLDGAEREGGYKPS